MHESKAGMTRWQILWLSKSCNYLKGVTSSCDCQKVKCVQAKQKHQKSQALGRLAEQKACEFLQGRGYGVIATNYKVANVGEIDIIARTIERRRDGRSFAVLVCVEVKARTVGGFGRAVETVGLAKQKRLINTISHFVQTHNEYGNDDIRFDVIAIDKTTDGLVINDDDWVCGAFLVH